jgi:hypothetical protein
MWWKYVMVAPLLMEWTKAGNAELTGSSKRNDPTLEISLLKIHTR